MGGRADEPAGAAEDAARHARLGSDDGGRAGGEPASSTATLSCAGVGVDRQCVIGLVPRFEPARPGGGAETFP
jgi:hypothetical protein